MLSAYSYSERSNLERPKRPLAYLSAFIVPFPFFLPFTLYLCPSQVQTATMGELRPCTRCVAQQETSNAQST
jgi:hypothetical protein